jgi:hypothetical protein
MSGAPPSLAYQSPLESKLEKEQSGILDEKITARASRLYSGESLSYVYTLLLTIGGLCIVAGISFPVGTLIVLIAAIIFAMDVRRHVVARELAERQVRSESNNIGTC